MSRYGLPHWLRGRRKVRHQKVERQAKWLRSWFHRHRLEQLESREAPGSILANVLGTGTVDPDSVLPAAVANAEVVQSAEPAAWATISEDTSAFVWNFGTPELSGPARDAESRTPAPAEAPNFSVSSGPMFVTGLEPDLDRDPLSDSWAPFGSEATEAESSGGERSNGGGGGDLGAPSQKLGTAVGAAENPIANSAEATSTGGGYSPTGWMLNGSGLSTPSGGSDWALSAFAAQPSNSLHASVTPTASPIVLPALAPIPAARHGVAPLPTATHPAANAAPTFTPPVLDSVQRFGPAGHERLLIHGNLASTAALGSSVPLDFFAQEPGNSVSIFLGSKSVTQTAAGSIDFTVNLAAQVPNGTLIAAAVHGRSDGAGWNQGAELPGGTAGTHPLGKPPAEVVTIPAGKKGESITLESPGHPLETVQVMTPPGLGDVLPMGLVGFTVTNVPAGGSAIVRMILPNDVHIQHYYKHDPVTGAVTLFDFDGRVGAEIHGNVVTLHLVDGGPGDADGVANGVIVDPGGASTVLLPGNIAAIPAATDGELVTLDSPLYAFQSVQTYDSPADAGVSLPLGLFGFTLTGVPVGGTADVQMIVPSDVSPSSYYKQDPVTGLMTPFEFDGTGGAQIDGQTITLQLVDGGEGDADGLADGVIVDPGGPSNISATEGFSWQGIVANITDSDSDGTGGPSETISGNVNWGDGTSNTSFSLPVSEGGGVSLTEPHTWKEKGTYTVTTTATDPDGGTTQTSVTATISDASLNWTGGSNPPNTTPTWGQTFEPAPSITTPANQTSTEGSSASLQIQASDSDGNTLSYDALDLPPGLSINASSGLISGTVAYGAAVEFGGSYTPTVIVADGHGGFASTAFTWTINQAQIGPVLNNPGNQSNVRGDSVSLQLSATQADSNPLTWSASNLPPSLTINPDTGLISGTIASTATLGTPYAVTVTVTDNATSLSASQSFNWTINATNVAPVLTNPGNQTNAAGDYVSLQLSASDADGDVLTYTGTGLPAGLTLDPITGLISGTLPNSAASATAYSVSVTASDGLAKSSQSFTWTVNFVSLQNPANQSNLDRDSVSLQLSAADASGLSLTPRWPRHLDLLGDGPSRWPVH
jgi:hypothetical protein